MRNAVNYEIFAELNKISISLKHLRTQSLIKFV